MPRLPDIVIGMIDLIGRSVILTAVIWFCRKSRLRNPHAGKYLLAAAYCQAASFAGLILMSVLLFPAESLWRMPPDDSDSWLLKLIRYCHNGYGKAQTGLQLATWLLIAYAILMQPEEDRTMTGARF